MKPWITNETELQGVLSGSAEEARSEVLVTIPASGPGDGIPVGRAIKAALKGRTRSLSMLVGFFGDGAAGETPEDSPLGLIRDEAAEELILPSDADCESPADQSEFRLLFGALAGDSRGVRLAVVGFWWACRWRTLDRVAADAWRDSLVSVWREEEHAAHVGKDFERFAFRAFSPSEVDGLFSVVTLLSEPERAHYSTWRQELEAAEDRTRTAASILATFFVLRRGHIRLQATGKSSDDQRGLFHGKLYVVERGMEQDTIAIMGSPNWSTGALFGSGTHANTEVASISRCAGWRWDQETGPSSLASRLANTARRLFEDSDRTKILASWSLLDEPLPEFDELLKLLADAKRRGDTFTEPEEPTPPEEVLSAIDPQLVPLAAGLLSLIERTLGLAGESLQARRFIDEHLGRTKNNFAGKQVQAAQIDGAIRLVEMLRDAPTDDTALGGRGAFLADEAGLGKSIVAQLVAFGLILEKLLDPRRTGGPLVTILAPHQLVVSEAGAGPDSGQWKRHRQELLAELHQALTSMLDRPGNLSADSVQRALDWVERERAEKQLHERQVRVMSHSTFQRSLRFDGTGEEVVRDHAHLAASEVVVLDESHNLRNGSSSRTRLARFLLSLPVPGEDWPIWVRKGTESRRLNNVPSDSRYARRVLCLTATPFNNTFEDIVTQIGHFARSQTWLVTQAEAAGQLALDGFDSPLVAALTAWTNGSVDGQEHQEQRLTAFRSLLETVAVPKEGRTTSHLRSGRRLDPDPAREEFGEGTSKAADGGPVYTWPGPYNELRHVVVVVATVLAQLVDEREDVEPPTPATVADATQRLDALLGRMFVQRSRSRIIKLMPDEDADRQFRAPRLPRLPLPLNEDGGAQVARAEVRILDRLFKQLGEEGTDGLSLFAYRLSTLRSGAGVAGSSEQKSSNLLGFQRMQLIKRLQSSRYAFLQTLLRGPLRHSLNELALIEWIADEVDNVPLNDAPDNWRKVVRDQAQIALGKLQDRTRDEGSWGAMLSLAVRGRAVREEGANTLRAWLLGSSSGEHIVKELLGTRGAERVNTTLDAGAPPPQREWLDKAVADLASGSECQLVIDVGTCLDWAFHDPRLELSSVVPFLSRETLGALEADIERSKGNRGLLSALRRHLMARGLGKDRDNLFDWLKKQLDEPRTCGLLGWVLGQAAAQAGGPSLEPRGGHRTLVFSEYADTVDHIAVVLQVVSLLAEELSSESKRSELADMLLRHTRNAIDLINEHASRVHEEVPQYDAPIATFAKLFAMPEGPERRRFVLEIAEQLARYSGIRTGEGAARLAGGVDATAVDESEDSETDLSEEFEEATDERVNDSPATEALVDAFAPWYRIDPLTLTGAAALEPTECAAALRRLDAAARQPLYTLVSTEVLAEGVNLQECGVVVHFDLPWNPTRLIQRNGRVDRRIQYRYENKHERDRVWRDLVRGAEMAWDSAPPLAPDLHPPRQVYHLTAVPPEPSLDHPDEEERELLRQKVESVRRTLLRKLRSIQILFGLSSWPIVLRAEESRAVLSGELEVETPGFRRREELYARRADLRDRLRKDNYPPVPVGTISVRVDQPPLRAAIARRLAGPEPGAAWAHLHEAGVQSWAQGGAPGRPVRSGTQWQENVRAITAWATTFDGDTAALLRWARRGESKNNVRRFSATPALSTAAWNEKFGWLVTTPGFAALPSLILEPNPAHDLRVHPLSPTGAAEELLDEIVHWLLTGRVNPENITIEDGDSPPIPPPPAGRGEAPSPGSYFVGAWQSAGLPVEAKASTATDYPAAVVSDEVPPALNIKLVFQRGAAQ